MGLREIIGGFRGNLQGRAFWRNLNRFIGIGIYTVLILGVLLFPMYLVYVLFGLAIVVPSYIAFFINHLRNMEKRDKGSKVIEGWITHAYGVGERVYFYPVKFELVDKLSPADLKSVREYVDNLSQASKNIDIGLNKFKPKNIQEETIRIEDMSKAERRIIYEEEKKEYEGFSDDHTKLKESEQKNNKRKVITLKEEEIELEDE